MSKGLIADIQRASTHDGPGIRTTVFFKGCPLSCKWCHNPECISFQKEILFYPDKCIHCGKCDMGCYSGARVNCGTEYMPRELMKIILEDSEYYGTDGGVTFSGGEPMAQPEFLKELTDMCIESNISTAVETSLLYFQPEILRNMAVIMADLKIWDGKIHREYTGVDNQVIKENFRRVNELSIPIIARTPIIPEINQEIDKISDFLKGLDNVKQYELLPYHSLGDSKRIALGLKPAEFSVPSKEYMEELKKYVFVR